MCRYDIYPGRVQGQKSLADSYPFHASALRDIEPVLRHGSGNSHVDPNMLCAPGDSSFLAKDPTKLVAGDAPVTFYTNYILTQKCKQK
jgi:hypothetical protein